MPKDFQKIGFSSSRIITNVLFGTMLLIIIVFNFYSFLQFPKLIEENRWVIHTYRVIEIVNEGLLNLARMESSARAYIILHDQKILEEVQTHMIHFQQNYASAAKMTSDSILQQQKFTALQSLLTERVLFIKKLIQYQPNQSNEIKQLLKESIVLSEKISFLSQEIISHELQLLQQRNFAFSNNLNSLNYFLLFTSLLSVIIFIIGIIILNLNLTRQRSFIQEKTHYENLMRNMMESTNDIIVALDMNYCFILFNQSFETEFKSIFGIKPRLNTSIISALNHLPEEQNKVRTLWEKALKGEEFNLIGNFGGLAYKQNVYECNFTPIYDSEGRLMGASAICRNIENRVQVEKSLKSINEELEEAYNQLKHHDAEVSLLNEMENALQSCSSIEETTLIITQFCQKLLSFAAGVIYLINPSRNYLEEIVQWNLSAPLEKVFSPRQCWGLRQGKNYLYTPTHLGLPCEHIQKNSIYSYICVPLLAQNEVIGLMHLIILDSEHLSEDDIQQLYDQHALLIQNLSVQLALAIANIQLRETLKNRSIRDSLTGLYNRTYLGEFLARDLQRAQRNQESVALIMMDIDHFKKFNDKWGHDAGDMVLKEFGKLLQDSTRKSDIASRYGGEEFLIILYDTPLEGACNYVDHLKTLISQLEIVLRGSSLDKITASFGLAMFPDHATSIEALITAADHALFLAKKNGRNQSCVFKKPENQQ